MSSLSYFKRWNKTVKKFNLSHDSDVFYALTYWVRLVMETDTQIIKQWFLSFHIQKCLCWTINNWRKGHNMHFLYFVEVWYWLGQPPPPPPPPPPPSPHTHTHTHTHPLDTLTLRSQTNECGFLFTKACKCCDQLWQFRIVCTQCTDRETTGFMFQVYWYTELRCHYSCQIYVGKIHYLSPVNGLWLSTAFCNPLHA